MNTLRCFYSRKTFDCLKKYVFSTYELQPKIMIIESDYHFALYNNGQKTLTPYRLVEIEKKDHAKIRILENDHSIGFWENIESMGIQGLDYSTLILSTKKNAYHFIRSESMESGKQTIRFLQIPGVDC